MRAVQANEQTDLNVWPTPRFLVGLNHGGSIEVISVEGVKGQQERIGRGKNGKGKRSGKIGGWGVRRETELTLAKS